MKSFKGATHPATATADRAHCENASIPIPGLPPTVLKAAIKMLQQCGFYVEVRRMAFPGSTASMTCAPNIAKYPFQTTQSWS